MTTEEQLEKLQADFEALSNKNKELITEKRKLQSKVGEIDFDAYNKAMEENDNLKGQVSKLNNDLGLKSKEVEKLSTTLNELDANLAKNKLSNVIKEQLTKYKFNPDAYEEAESYLEKHFKVENDNIITSNNKSVDEFMTEYSQRKALLIMPSGNVGTSASGGSNNGGVSEAKYFDRNSKDFNLTKQAEVYHTNPTLYNQLKGN
jgi:predicted nuclease with TOPRIM domain